MSNVAKQTIPKSKQGAVLVLFNKIAEKEGSQNKALIKAKINKETLWRWKENNFMTLKTAEKILRAYKSL